MKAKFYLAKEFRQYLKLRGLNVKRFAKDMGYSQQYCYQVLAGSVEPTLPFLRKLCGMNHFELGEVVDTKFIGRSKE
jgi:transcriptional regulator with XRE-family HTH domain